MSNLMEVSIYQTDKWDEIVKSFKPYDVFYLNSYAKAFQLQGDGEPVLFYYENMNDRGINVVMKRDIAKFEYFQGLIKENTYFDLYSPYGYGGFWSDETLTQDAVKEYEQLCLEKGYVCEFVRFQLFQKYKDYFGGCVESYTHNVIRNLEIPLDDMMMDFEHKVRKNLKKAVASGLEIEVDLTGERMDDFLRIYYGTMDRRGAKCNFFFDRSFFETISCMKENATYFHAIYEGKVISTELVIYGAENAYSFLGGTDCNYFDLRPNDYLKFEIIKWCKDKGLRNLVLGGGYGYDDGIFKYKRSLAPNGVVDFYVGKKIFNQTVYDNLIALRKKTNPDCENSRFFPAYRA